MKTRYNGRVDQPEPAIILTDEPNEQPPRSALDALIERPPFNWTQDSLLCLALDAEGRMSTNELAMGAGVNADTVRRWRKHPEYAAAKQDLLDRFAEQFAQATMASKGARASRMAARLEQLNQIVEERGAAASPDTAEAAEVAFDPELVGVPGATTGLIVKRERVIGAGEAAVNVLEFEVDTGLIAAEASLSKQLAQELGQWTEKTESTVTRKLYIGINIDDM